MRYSIEFIDLGSHFRCDENHAVMAQRIVVAMSSPQYEQINSVQIEVRGKKVIDWPSVQREDWSEAIHKALLAVQSDTTAILLLTNADSPQVKRYGINLNVSAHHSGVNHDESLRMCFLVRHSRSAIERIGFDGIRQECVNINTAFSSLYGYAKAGKYSRDTWWRNHNPWDGPSRLEWMNWFSEEYYQNVSVLAKRTLPIVKVRVDNRTYYLLSLSEDPANCLSISKRLLEYKWRFLIGMGLFSREVSPIWNYLIRDVSVTLRKSARIKVHY